MLLGTDYFDLTLSAIKNSEKLLSIWCGTMEPTEKFSSDTNHLLVSFVTDNRFSAGGFKFAYEETESKYIVPVFMTSFRHSHSTTFAQISREFVSLKLQPVRNREVCKWLILSFSETYQALNHSLRVQRFIYIGLSDKNTKFIVN